MAMDKGALARKIKNELLNVDTHETAMIKLATAIKDYVESKCEITFTWNGIMPPPANTVDPITSYKGKVKFPLFKITSPPSIQALGLILATEFVKGIITPKQVGFVLPPTNFKYVPIIITESKADNQTDALEHISGEIIDGLKKMINKKPLLGSHASFTAPSGTGAVMVSIK